MDVSFNYVGSTFELQMLFTTVNSIDDRYNRGKGLPDKLDLSAISEKICKETTLAIENGSNDMDMDLLQRLQTIIENHLKQVAVKTRNSEAKSKEYFDCDAYPEKKHALISVSAQLPSQNLLGKSSPISFNSDSDIKVKHIIREFNKLNNCDLDPSEHMLYTGGKRCSQADEPINSLIMDYGIFTKIIILQKK